MPTRQNLELDTIRPLRLFVIILVLLFTIEVLVMLVLPHLLPHDGTKIVEALIDACLLTGVLAPLLWYLIVKPLQKLAATRQRLLALTLSAHESERGRNARDLHDSVGQSLTGLMIGLKTMESLTQIAALQQQARELRQIGSDMHDEIRRLARGLRPAVLDDLGLVPALERLVEDLAASHQIEATFERDCEQGARLPDDLQTAVYRIVQEAATNAVRHGKAKHVQIKLTCSPRKLTIAVSDDGVGFEVAAALRLDQVNSPFGLLSIHERAGLLGGEAQITSQPGRGTQIRVTFPLQELVASDG
ncbi:sensor histidine kinase [Anatilimnocola floriformis]|uniref:sensor histidine kinase n=1 Tax=Anatilimnocola floriformis TaxID=2948575 RepID=UPI0020C1D424|nr:sensor histidine kinase [Anatilimnocola floriformis]